MNRRNILAAGTLATLASALPAIARAQIVAKPSRIVVGFPAGGGTDVVARLLAEKLRGKVAANLIVDNRAGAAARLAVEYVKAADTDGSVLLFTPDFPMVLYPHSYKKLSYDPVRDFAPVAACATTSLALSVGPMVPVEVKTVADFVKWCKANPGKAAFASTGAGASPHFAGILFAKAAGIEMNHVPYKGGAPAVQDLIGGQIASSVNPIGEVLPYAKAGRIRVLATTGPKRTRLAPEIPTMVESGYPDVLFETWLGLFAPARTPQEIITRLEEAVREALQSTDVQEGLAKLGYEAPFIAGAQFRERLRRDFERWGPIVKASGFTAED